MAGICFHNAKYKRNQNENNTSNYLTSIYNITTVILNETNGNLLMSS